MATSRLSFPDSAFAWRRRRKILPLSYFDFPEAHICTRFDPSVLSDLTIFRMAGSSFKMSPQEIRDAVRSENLSKLQRGYLAEVFEQCDGLDIRMFRHNCGASLYELARTMIECEVTHPFVSEWMNSRSPKYDPPESETSLYRLVCNLGR